jgi:opacity protein-like surface antigen
MKRIAFAALLSVIVAAPAVAAENKGNVGANFSTAGAFGVQGELNISSMTNKAPISVQAFWKNYTWDYASSSWGINGIGAAAIYDFSSMAKLDKKVEPYAGLGLVAVSYSWRGANVAPAYTGVGGGLYVTAGVRYALTHQVAVDFNYNNFGDLTAGVNFNF